MRSCRGKSLVRWGERIDPDGRLSSVSSLHITPPQHNAPARAAGGPVADRDEGGELALRLFAKSCRRRSGLIVDHRRTDKSTELRRGSKKSALRSVSHA